MVVVEKAYEVWRNSEEKTIKIGDYTYYRIVWSECLKLITKEKETLCVVLSPDMPSGRYFQDENGNHFTFNGLYHIRFIYDIPEWYSKSGQCGLEWKETKK